VVTGGASGIGAATCRHLAVAGRSVAVLDLDGDGARRVAAELRADGFAAVGAGADVTDRRSLDDAFAQVRADLGPTGILVASAGMVAFDDFAAITPQRWDQVVAVNLTGTFHACQAALPDMVEAGWGRIVTISSSSAQSGAANMAHYIASKGGVLSLTKALAVELARKGITVNTIPPSLVDTPMSRHAEATGDFPGVDKVAPFIPLGRAGTPDDIAGACSFLCSDDGSYITGQVIGVNGGMYV
jgi:2-hydroxycyclohexanecarboxyl-CoA dehydrogenase